MYKNNKIIAIIPARGGSKGVPNKNIRPINGLHLVSYTINAALQSKFVDKVIVSTDSKRIMNISLSFGASVPFLRPKYLATDQSKTIDSVLYTLERLSKDGENFDSVILLQPTSPLRTTNDIDSAIEFFYEHDEDLVSIHRVDVNPFLFRTLKENCVVPIMNMPSTIRRQDLPPIYKVDGSIYINKVSRLDKNTSLNDNRLGFVIDKMHSLDIDSYFDLKEARRLLKK